ncbi:hypothetical protein AIOL_001328 [Candidatus Rhodobacter oscarellae]|uniref:Uncharacterized protein n=1 Tax=Candidatus Rhodobacter oscarellae TaxID=1675527 RepID=A0A0J9E0B4_9RHOB|nr:EscD/YscD/HrpQ family type III secretion system periplasmic domain-containing protein [Candidatus Rhodobacter lobularis]KMW56376.1 hypothetical protein AIOL_001328 [Candidatus Rhodobacter lobularis]
MTSQTIKLIVAEGVHRGAQVEFGLGSVLSLGRDTENDIALSDLPEISEAEHLRVAFSKAGRVDVYAVGSDVTVEGVLLTSGEAVSAPLPCSLSVGPVGITMAAGRTSAVSGVQERRKSDLQIWPRFKTPALLAAPVLALLIMSNAYATTEAASDQSGEPNMLTEYRIQPGVPKSLPGLVSPPPADRIDRSVEIASRSPSTEIIEMLSPSTQAPPAPQDVAERFLAERLKALDLEDIALEFNGKVIIASGELSQADRERWKQVAPDLDQEFGADYILITDFSDKIASVEMPQRPTAVWLSQQPYFVDSRGSRWNVGDTTSEGWTVLAIDFTGVKVTQGDREVLIPLDLEGQN